VGARSGKFSVGWQDSCVGRWRQRANTKGSGGVLRAPVHNACAAHSAPYAAPTPHLPRRVILSELSWKNPAQHFPEKCFTILSRFWIFSIFSKLTIVFSEKLKYLFFH